MTMMMVPQVVLELGLEVAGMSTSGEDVRVAIWTGEGYDGLVVTTEDEVVVGLAGASRDEIMGWLRG